MRCKIIAVKLCFVIVLVIDAELQAMTQGTVTRTGQKRKAPTCKKCGLPRKGHKKGQCSGNSSI